MILFRITHISLISRSQIFISESEKLQRKCRLMLVKVISYCLSQTPTKQSVTLCAISGLQVYLDKSRICGLLRAQIPKSLQYPIPYQYPLLHKGQCNPKYNVIRHSCICLQKHTHDPWLVIYGRFYLRQFYCGWVRLTRNAQFPLRDNDQDVTLNP